MNNLRQVIRWAETWRSVLHLLNWFLKVRTSEHSHNSTIYAYDEKTHWHSDWFIFVKMINEPNSTAHSFIMGCFNFYSHYKTNYRSLTVWVCHIYLKSFSKNLCHIVCSHWMLNASSRHYINLHRFQDVSVRSFTVQVKEIWFRFRDLWLFVISWPITHCYSAFQLNPNFPPMLKRQLEQ
jgi:hypothetical protein